VEPLIRRLRQIFGAFHINTQIASMKERGDKVEVVLEGEAGKTERTFDRVLVAVGRQPNSRNLGLEKTRVKVKRSRVSHCG
jgi:dihydrolipoamide dehydrogenase